jgi:hypothetical protein
VSLTESGLDAIATLKERLDLQACTHLNDEAVPVLESLSALRVVDLSATISEKALGELRKAKPGLQVMAIGYRAANPAMPNGPEN